MLSPVGNVEKDQRLPLEFSSSGKTSGGEQPSWQRRSNRGGRPTGGWRPLRAAPTGRDPGLRPEPSKAFRDPESHGLRVRSYLHASLSISRVK